jgi:peptide/nickel transport system substrate-binding protein
MRSPRLGTAFLVVPLLLAASGQPPDTASAQGTGKTGGQVVLPMVANPGTNHIALEANPDFFLGRPKLDRVIFKVLPDANTQVAQLKTGEIDLMPRVDVSVAPSIQGTKGVRIDTGLVPQFWALHLNHDFPLFTDKKVRQAIAYAIDREALIRDVLYGQGRVAAGPIAPILTWAFNPNVKAYPYDPAKSKVLLQEAGWTDTNGDGVIDKDGKPFSFTLQILKGFPVAERTSAILQQSFKSLGMDAKLQAYEFASFITDVRDTRQGPKMSQAYVVFMLLAPEPDDIWAYFHSSNTAKGSNFNNYRNPEVDRLLDLARSRQDRGARRNAYFKVQEILHDDVARDFLFYPNEIYAMKSGLRGVPVTGPYPYVEQWHWE